MDTYITVLFGQVENCGNLKEQVLRDRIVVGIHDRETAGLTLEKAKTSARERELRCDRAEMDDFSMNAMGSKCQGTVWGRS